MRTTVDEGPAAVLGFEPPEGCSAYATVGLFAETEAVYEQWRDRLAEAGHAFKENVWWDGKGGKQCKALQWSEGSVYCSIHGLREPRA